MLELLLVLFLSGSKNFRGVNLGVRVKVRKFKILTPPSSICIFSPCKQKIIKKCNQRKRGGGGEICKKTVFSTFKVDFWVENSIFGI